MFPPLQTHPSIPLRVMPRSRLRPLFMVLLAASAAACGSEGGGGITGPVTPPPANPNYVRLQSDPGDYIGQGRSYEYSQADAVLGVTAGPGRLTLTVTGDERWSGDFQLPSGNARLVAGTYSGLRRYPFHDIAAGGLSWSGEGRGCNTLIGSFTIDSVRYDGAQLAAIGLRFEQRCEGGATVLRGAVRWRSDDPTRPPGPVTPPAGLWSPPSSALPATGNVLYLSSTPGDWIGGGFINTYTDAIGSVTVSGSGLTFSGHWWSGRFYAMNVVPQLRTGYYGQLRRWPFHNPTRGGMDWAGQGRGCNRLFGWFVIDRITYTGDRVSAVELRFEQRCESPTAPPLYGFLRWSE